VTQRYDVAVVGGGLVGLATALQVVTLRPGARVVVLEKERELALHQSGHTSGVIHAGLYYPPGSLKARLCREGADLLRAFADEHGVPWRTTGKLVVALDERELPRLEELRRRGEANGLRGLREVGPAEMRELEPHVAGVRGLHVPETGVIDFRRVADAYARELERRGGEVRLGARVDAIRQDAREASLETTAGAVGASSNRTRSGRVLTNMPTMVSTPGSAAGRPETTLPKTTSASPL
jgi:L-2-hydroxyglutarate oxidase LhgO